MVHYNNCLLIRNIKVLIKKCTVTELGTDQVNGLEHIKRQYIDGSNTLSASNIYDPV